MLLLLAAMKKKLMLMIGLTTQIKPRQCGKWLLPFEATLQTEPSALEKPTEEEKNEPHGGGLSTQQGFLIPQGVLAEKAGVGVHWQVIQAQALGSHELYRLLISHC